MKAIFTFKQATNALAAAVLFFFLSFPQQTKADGWSDLGGGLSGWVYASTVYNGDLIVGGDFTYAGGVAANHIARWDGTSWHALGDGLDGSVWALTVYNGKLIAGGFFVNAGSVNVNYIAKWNGTSWSDLEGGTNSYVVSLTVYNGDLIAGGYFTTADFVADYVAKWDGSSWSALGTGMGGSEGQVMALTVWNNNLIAAGFFTIAGGISANHIASWDGSSWSALGDGIGWITYALTVYNGDLIAGGLFSSAGGVEAHDVAKWDGTSWSALGSGIGGGVYGYVLALTTYNGNLIAGGIYTTAGGNDAANIAAWDGTAWTPLATYMNSGGTVQAVYTLTPYSGDVVAGGIFTDVDGTGCGNVAAWHGFATGVAQQETINSYQLFQNDPNPFNASTTISFEIANAGKVQLTVYNMLGERMIVLLNQFMKEGHHSLVFNSKELPEGNYFYKLECNEFSQVKEMSVAK